MKVLLTGGAGFIGSHTAVDLLNNGYEVVIADNFCNSKPEAVRRIEAVTGKPVTLYRIDVCDKEALDALFRGEPIGAVIHFAGLKAVGESVSLPLSYYRNNLDSTLTLLETMKKHGCSRIIFSSSATVYGDPATVPITEDMPTGQCSNPYGRTKYMIEQILSDLSAADPSLSVVLLRYFNPIGAHESGLLVEDPKGIPNNLMPLVLQAALGQRDRLTVFGNDYPTKDGTGVRDYIHVCDLARGHVAALRYAETHTGVEAVNLGTGKGYSVLELLDTFTAVTGQKAPYVISGRRPGDIAACYASPEKAEALLGWRAERGIAEMCRDSWNAVCRNPDGYPDSTQ